jgi:tetratricopeptide (TPR) repeat protein
MGAWQNPDHAATPGEMAIMLNEALSQTIDQETSAALLRMGVWYYERGLLLEATSPYLKLIACYPDSAEATEAIHRVILIAKTYEQRGQVRMAEAIYDRLQEVDHFNRWDGNIAEESRDAVPA